MPKSGGLRAPRDCPVMRSNPGLMMAWPREVKHGRIPRRGFVPRVRVVRRGDDCRMRGALMARAILDLYADMVGAVMMAAVDRPSIAIGTIVVAIAAIVVYQHKEDLA